VMNGVFSNLYCFASMMPHKHKKVAIHPTFGMNCNICDD